MDIFIWVMMLIISIVVSYLPIVGKYVKVINTLVHESGHAIMALLTSGKVYKIELFANAEGVAITSNNWFGRLLTSIAGYVSSSAVSYLFVYLLIKEQYEMVLWVLFFLSIVNLILWVRNIYGLFWLITFIGICLVFLFTPLASFSNYAVLFFTSVIFSQAVITSYIILLLSIKQRENAGDATNLGRTLSFPIPLTKIRIGVPVLFWGLFFFIQSLVFVYLTVILFV